VSRLARTWCAGLLWIGGAVHAADAPLPQWWRLDETASPFTNASGKGEAPKWWRHESSNHDYRSASAPPASLYRTPFAPSVASFDAAATYEPGGNQKPCILKLPSDGGLAAEISDWTLECFYRAPEVDLPERKLAIVTYGDGCADYGWHLMLTQKGPVFTLIDMKGAELRVQLPEPPRDGGDLWHYVVVRLQDRKLTLLLADEKGNTRVSPTVLVPDDFDTRASPHGLLVGRSSIYYDRDNESYQGTWDTFTGCIADIRITKSALPDEQLLGAFKRP
jgi:hypothetical protein